MPAEFGLVLSSPRQRARRERRAGRVRRGARAQLGRVHPDEPGQLAGTSVRSRRSSEHQTRLSGRPVALQRPGPLLPEGGASGRSGDRGLAAPTCSVRSRRGVPVQLGHAVSRASRVIHRVGSRAATRARVAECEGERSVGRTCRTARSPSPRPSNSSSPRAAAPYAAERPQPLPPPSRRGSDAHRSVPVPGRAARHRRLWVKTRIKTLISGSRRTRRSPISPGSTDRAQTQCWCSSPPTAAARPPCTSSRGPPGTPRRATPTPARRVWVGRRPSLEDRARSVASHCASIDDLGDQLRKGRRRPPRLASAGGPRPRHRPDIDEIGTPKTDHKQRSNAELAKVLSELGMVKDALRARRTGRSLPPDRRQLCAVVADVAEKQSTVAGVALGQGRFGLHARPAGNAVELRHDHRLRRPRLHACTGSATSSNPRDRSPDPDRRPVELDSLLHRRRHRTLQINGRFSDAQHRSMTRVTPPTRPAWPRPTPRAKFSDITRRRSPSIARQQL